MAQTNGSLRPLDGWALASRWWRVLRISYLRYFSSGGYIMAAAIAFYALICLAPLGILAAAILQRVLGGGSDSYVFLQQAVAEYGGDAAQPIMHSIDSLLANPGSYVANVVSVAAVVWAGLGLVEAIQISLTFIWPGRRRRAFLPRKLVSLAMMAAAGLILAILVMSRFLAAALRGWLVQYSQVDPSLLDPLRPLGFHGSAFLFSGCAYFVLYKTMPVQKVPWKAALAGALSAACLWQALFPAFLYLMTRSHQINPIYGGLGGVVVFGLWAFLGAQVLLFGGLFAASYEHVFTADRPRSEDDTLIDTARRRLQMTRLLDFGAESERILAELELQQETAPHAAEGCNAIILSNGRVNPHLIDKLGAEHRGLVPVGGRCSVEWVVAALRELPQVHKIVLIGEREAYLRSPVADQVDGIIEEGPDLVHNLLRAVRFLGEARRVLLTSADTPLVSAPVLGDFLRQCDSRADLCYPVTRYNPAEKWARRHWQFQPLTGGWVSHSCHVLVDPRLILQSQEFVERFIAPRRDLLSAAGEVGLGAMVRFLLSWYLPALRDDLDSSDHRLAALTGARRCQGVRLEAPEIALALERPEDVMAAEAWHREHTTDRPSTPA